MDTKSIELRLVKAQINQNSYYYFFGDFQPVYSLFKEKYVKIFKMNREEFEMLMESTPLNELNKLAEKLYEKY